MRTQGSFLMRCWLIQEETATERTIFDIEHVQTGEHERVENLAEAQHWIVQKCQASSRCADPDEDS
jgi:hypothetical protein